MEKSWRYSPHHKRRAVGALRTEDLTHTVLACHAIWPDEGTIVAHVYNDDLLPVFLAAPETTQFVEDYLKARDSGDYTALDEEAVRLGGELGLCLDDVHTCRSCGKPEGTTAHCEECKSNRA